MSLLAAALFSLAASASAPEPAIAPPLAAQADGASAPAPAIALPPAPEADRASTPCASPPFASFSHEVRGGRQVTIAGIAVPAPLAEVAAVLADPAALAGWLFMGPGAVPTIHDVTWDRATGAFSLRLGASGTGTPFAGTLAIATTPTETSMRGSGSDGDVKEWIFDVTAREDPACAAHSVVSIRIELAFSMKARLFGGSTKSLPVLLALAARDDIASRFVLTAERLRDLGVEDVVTLASGRPGLALGDRPPAEILTFRPHALGVGAGRRAAFGKSLEKMTGDKADAGKLIEAIKLAIDGRHPVTSWSAELAGHDSPAVLMRSPDSIHAGATVRSDDGGMSLSFSAGVSRD